MHARIIKLFKINKILSLAGVVFYDSLHHSFFYGIPKAVGKNCKIVFTKQ